MYRICKTEESAARQHKLEQCLLELMKQKPYADISVGELAAQAGISRIAFYRYFKGKDGCLCALLDHSMTGFIGFQLPDEYRQYEGDQFFISYCAYWLHLKPLLDVLHKNGLMRWLLDRNIEYINQEAIDRIPHIPDSKFRENIVAFTAGGVLTMLYHWYLRGFDRSIPEMAHLLEQLLNVRLSADLSFPASQ